MKSIKSKYIFQELFSFIPSKRKFKIIKYNSFLHNKLDLSIIDYKQSFFNQKLKNIIIQIFMIIGLNLKMILRI